MLLLGGKSHPLPSVKWRQPTPRLGACRGGRDSLSHRAEGVPSPASRTNPSSAPPPSPSDKLVSSYLCEVCTPQQRAEVCREAGGDRRGPPLGSIRRVFLSNDFSPRAQGLNRRKMTYFVFSKAEQVIFKARGCIPAAGKCPFPGVKGGQAVTWRTPARMAVLRGQALLAGLKSGTKLLAPRGCWGLAAG